MTSEIEQYTEAMAELVVRFGANVQPGQVVASGAEPGNEQMVRAIADHAFRSRTLSDSLKQDFLQLDGEQPVIEIWHTGWTAEDRAVEVAVHSVPAYLWVLDYGWPID